MAHTDVASQDRYRTGSVDTVTVADHVTYPVQKSDLVYMSAGVAYPASAQADGGTATANKTTFAANFLGVALSKDGLQTGETSARLTTRKGTIVVGTTGDYEFPCDATSWVSGDLVSAVEVAAGTGLEDQKVAKTTLEYEAIGIAKVPVHAIGTSMTSIIVSLRSQTFRADVGSGQ